MHAQDVVGVVLVCYLGMAASLFAWALAATPARRRAALAVAIANALLAFCTAVWPIVGPK